MINLASKKFALLATILASIIPTTMLHSAEPPTPATPNLPERLVTLGDSITDGHTYQILLDQALKEAGHKDTLIINAGIASDTAAMMLARLDRDVLPYKPQLVTMMAGTNDVMQNVPPEKYEATVEQIASKMDAAGIKMILLTPPIIGPKHEDKNKTLAIYIAGLERIAQRHGFAIARVHENMRKAANADKSVNLLSSDDIHLSFAGYRVLTRSVLDAMGYRDIKVPEKMHLYTVPGLIESWQVRVAPDAKPLDDAAAAALTADATWKTLNLPQDDSFSSTLDWWENQERERGFGHLKPVLGAAKLYQGMTVISSPTEREVFFNTGAQLNGLWLNGVRLYKNTGWTGWHAGKERIKATLRPGKNTVVIEMNDVFFAGMTYNNNW